MDLGLFCSSRRKITLFVLGPVLFLVIFYFAFYFFLKSANNSLKEHISLIENVPIMSKKIKMAERILSYYKIASSEMDSVEMLNARINRMARNTNFTLNSLIVERPTKEVLEAGVSIFKVAIKGEGPLVAIIKFFQETYNPDKLFAVETVTLTRDNLDVPDYYNAYFVFSYYAIPLNN